MRSCRALLATSALAGLLSGCAGSGGTAAPSGTPTASATRPVVGPTVPVSASPSPGVPAPAGSLLDASVPLATRTATAQLYFAGLAVDRGAQGERKVLYPAAEVQYDDEGHVVVHLKLPVFSCPTYGDLTRLKRTACRSRTVTYADADERSVTLTKGPGESFVADVVAATYRYGTGTDRSPKVARTPTGETVSLRMRVRPGAVLSRKDGTVTFRAKGFVQRPGTPGVAVQDDAYDNRLVRHGG